MKHYRHVYSIRLDEHQNTFFKSQCEKYHCSPSQMIRLILDKFQTNQNDSFDDTDMTVGNRSIYDKILEKINAIHAFLKTQKFMHSDLERVNSIDDKKKQESNDN